MAVNQIDTFNLEQNYWGGLINYIIHLANTGLNTGNLEYANIDGPVTWYMDCNFHGDLPMLGVGR